MSNKGDKTVVVRVERRFAHPVYKKTVRRFRKLHAHDAENRCQLGELVTIQETPPVSKMKHWTVLQADRAAGSEGGEKRL